MMINQIDTDDKYEYKDSIANLRTQDTLLIKTEFLKVLYSEIDLAKSSINE